MQEKKRILFLCTGNSCRSQMAEALLRQIGGDRFEVFSAGSHPAGFIYPLAEEAMRALNVPMENQESKSWDGFTQTPVDLVITLCDAVALETCPDFPGAPLKVHWPLPDPAFHTGTDKDRIEFAIRVAQRLRTKIQGLTEMDWSLAADELKARLEFLGEI